MEDLISTIYNDMFKDELAQDNFSHQNFNCHTPIKYNNRGFENGNRINFTPIHNYDRTPSPRKNMHKKQCFQNKNFNEFENNFRNSIKNLLNFDPFPFNPSTIAPNIDENNYDSPKKNNNFDEINYLKDNHKKEIEILNNEIIKLESELKYSKLYNSDKILNLERINDKKEEEINKLKNEINSFKYNNSLRIKNLQNNINDKNEKIFYLKNNININSNEFINLKNLINEKEKEIITNKIIIILISENLDIFEKYTIS